MKKQNAVAILAALAQANRLDAFRLLVEAGPDGMPAGHLATALRLPPSALSFHLERLRAAGLIGVRRDGRSLIYAARLEAMNSLVGYLTDHCCQGRPELCKPKLRGASRHKRETRIPA